MARDDDLQKLGHAIDAFERVVRERHRRLEAPRPEPERPHAPRRRLTLSRPVVVTGLLLLASGWYVGLRESGEPVPARAVEQVDRRPPVVESPAAPERVPIATARAPLDTDREVADADDAPETAVTASEAERDAAADAPPDDIGADTAPPQPGDYALQVAAYATRELADALADRLTDAGYPTFVVRSRNLRPAVFRVRLGGYPDQATATAVGRRVNDETGLDWYLVNAR